MVYYLKKINANGWSEKKLEVLKYCKRAKNMEGMVLADVDLCESMLGMFIDIQPDYIYIVTIANRFSIEHVKKIYFE